MYLLYRIVKLIYRGNFPMDVGCWLCQDVYNFSLYIHWCKKMRTIDRLTFISLLLSFEGWNYWEKIFIFHSSLRLMTYHMILVDQPCKHLLSSSLLITLLIPVDFFTVDYCTYTCLPHYFWLSYRYLLRFGRILQRLELDAFLAMSVSPLLHDVQTMQDLKVCTLLFRLDVFFHLI